MVRFRLGKTGYWLFACLISCVLALSAGCANNGKKPSRFFTKLPEMNEHHSSHSMFELISGIVLVTDCLDAYITKQPNRTSKDEIYDVKDNKFVSLKHSGLGFGHIRRLLFERILESEVSFQAYPGCSGEPFFNRSAFQLNFLGNGFYLITGGFEKGLGVSSTIQLRNITDPNYIEIYKLSRPRFAPTVTVLNNGTVLIAGGDSDNLPLVKDRTEAITHADLFDFKKRKVIPTQNMQQDRICHSAIRLSDGTILIMNGVKRNSHKYFTRKIEQYNPQTKAFKIIGLSIYNRCNGVSTLLDDGRILTTGGISAKNLENYKLYKKSTATAEIFNPKTRSSIDVSSMIDARTKFSSLKLRNGSVLITGGNDAYIEDDTDLRLYSAELFKFY